MLQIPCSLKPLGGAHNLKPWPCHTDLAVAQSIQSDLGLRFSRKDITLGEYQRTEESGKRRRALSPTKVFYM